MKHKSIFNAVAVAMVAVALIMGGGASAQTKSVPLKIDPRLVGTWWHDRTADSDCMVFEFTKNGAGWLRNWCDAIGSFKFTSTNGWIKFHSASYCGDDGCGDIELDDLDFSFSDDGKTLILGGKMFKKVVNGKVDGEYAGCC